MDTYYCYHTREFFITLGRLWFERLEDELWKFAQPLSEWLYHLNANPTPNWRPSLDRFLAQQGAEGREPTPESLQELEAFLADWASEAFPSDPSVVQLSVREKVDGALLLELDDKLSQLPRRGGRPTPWRNALDKQPFAIFHRKLQEADLYLRELEQAIPPLARKLDAAKLDEPVEVDDDLDRIEKLIWLHNEALEKAREAWLAGDLGSEAYDKLMLASSPAAHGLPMFVDPQQAERAKAQWKQIGERLKQRIAMLDKIILAMQVLEGAGQVATALLGVGVLAKALMVGGKLVFVKTLAKVAVGGVISEGASEAAAAGMRAVGANEETIEGVQTAVEIISWLLILRRINKKLPSGHAKASPSKKTPTEDPIESAPDTPAASPKPKGTGLVPAAPFELGKWGEARLRVFLGGLGFKPTKAYKTSHGNRFVDWMLNGIAHEAKAGINVTLRSCKLQILKDVELIAKRKIDGAHWHFFQGAEKDLLDFLDSAKIPYTVH